MLGLCLRARSFSVGIHDGCRIAVVLRNFPEGGHLVNCELGQEEFVLSFVRRRLGRFGRVLFSFGGWFELDLDLRCSED